MPKLVSLSPPMEAAAGLTANAAMYDIQEALLAVPEFMAHLGIDEEWVRVQEAWQREGAHNASVKGPLGPQLLGSGMYALVYALPDESKVLKVTEDAQDAQVAKLILDAGGEIRGLVRVFDVVALPRDYRGHHPSGAKRGGERKFWGLVVERVQRKSRRVPSLLPMANDALQGHGYWDEDSRARLLVAFHKAATSGSPGKADLAYGWLWLHDRGYDVGDLHDGNIGWSPARRQAVLIDFGFGEGAGPEVRTVKNPSLTPNRATLGDIQAALLRAPNFLASLDLTEADVADIGRRELGVGHYAHAFLLPNGLVLKVTDDEADARVCKLVLDAGSGRPGLPHIQSVHRLPGTVRENETDVDEERPIYAIVMEAVSPASKTFVAGRNGRMTPRQLGEAVLYPSMEPELPSDEAREFVRQIRKGLHWLARYGVAVIDLHHNNIGYASGKRPVIFDFGHESLREDFQMTPIKLAANRGAPLARAKAGLAPNARRRPVGESHLPPRLPEWAKPKKDELKRLATALAGPAPKDALDCLTDAQIEKALFGFSSMREELEIDPDEITWNDSNQGTYEEVLAEVEENGEGHYDTSIPLVVDLLWDGSFELNDGHHRFVVNQESDGGSALAAEVQIPPGLARAWARKLLARTVTPNARAPMPKVRAAFDECFDALVEQFPDFGDLELHEDEKAGGDNGHGSERQFGYCMDGKPIRVAFAAKTEDLPVANIRGLMAHEFGHALDYRYGDKLGKMLGQRLPDGVERRADSIAKAVFGRTIKYDGRDIQCVACQGKSVRPRRLGP